jgi:tRNA 2-thiouridine synthesizing protein D|tara:strand:+ start:265 stop:654 length:390 start_codon:yes stop_codon:yes gene_type:complete
MKYTLAIHGAPYASQSAQHGLAFAEALLRQEHSIERIFFFHEGVYQALSTRVTPQGEEDLLAKWQTLSNHGVELAVCIAGGIKRGVINEDERKRYEKNSNSLAEHFTLVGLGQLISAINNADRYVEFSA